MLEINYTDTIGTFTIIGGYAPENSIVNAIREVCSFCQESSVNDPNTLCSDCCEEIAYRIDKAEHQNRCDW